jgi:heterotetrameric sarcosine oxidase alpha subunit
MTQSHRNSSGGFIDRKLPINFTFNGDSYQGFAGDTLASALLANGVHVIGRSFKYHRPRGVFAIGPEEPNALVQLACGPYTQPNTRASQVELYEGLTASSQNCWPGLKFDLLAVNDKFSAVIRAGFYNKTFMSPRWLWPGYEKLIRNVAGMGRSPVQADLDHYQQKHEHCDVLVVGAGPAGLMAAQAAADSGARVIIVDEAADAGGWLRRDSAQLEGKPALDWFTPIIAALKNRPNVVMLTRTTAFGYYDHNLVACLERVSDHINVETVSKNGKPRQRLWRIRAKQVILATGAIERPLTFANNDLPGIMLAGAARAYLNQYAVKAGSRAVVLTNNDSAYHSAIDLHDVGIKVECVIDQREDPDSALVRAVRERKIRVIKNGTITHACGKQAVEAVEISNFDALTKQAANSHRIACDLVCVSGGWTPVIHLHAQSGGRASYDTELATFVPAECKQAERSVGAARGLFGLSDCIRDGLKAGIETAQACGFSVNEQLSVPEQTDGFDAISVVGASPSSPQQQSRYKQFIDLQNDVTTNDIKQAHSEGYISVEHLKRYTTLGMGTDQGKTSNINGLALLAQHRQEAIPAVGTTTFRPPYTPISLGSLAGPGIKTKLAPKRLSPMHALHEKAGAVFVPNGLWLRPQCYPLPGESNSAAVLREMAAVRNKLGVVDVSTLGKIEIKGKDAVEFLNRVYINGWDTLPVGRCRYGVMLREDGMILDDGTTSRLAEHHFFMTTTTGNAEQVLQHLEFFLEVVWHDLDVNIIPVTEQWAALAVAGPQSRELLCQLIPDVDLSSETLPYMGMLECTLAGYPVRLMRISFSGELAYEIYVPSSQGAKLWDQLLSLGKEYNVTPYGMDALDMLRVEKGFIAMGTEADGRVTPYDLGMARMVSKKKDFIGRIALNRPALQADDRLSLVGLIAEDNAELREGAHILATENASGFGASIGHISSAAYSTALNKPVALAMLKSGQTRHDETVYVCDPVRDNTLVPVKVVTPCFYDPAGDRLRI